jgi:hypothetical protein
VIVSNHFATVSALNAPVARYDHTADERAGAFFAYAIAIIFRLSSRLFDRAFHVGSIARVHDHTIVLAILSRLTWPGNK